MDEVVILSPLGMLGYGVPEASVERARREFDVDVVAVDAGSMDPGPNYLGRGEPFTDEAMVERDLRILLAAAVEEGVPLLVGSAGGSGSRAHVEAFQEILRRVADGLGVSVPTATIYTDVDRSYAKEKVDRGEVEGLGWEAPLSAETIDRAERIVAQVGATSFVEALDRGAELVIGGRSSDLAPFSAVPLREGFDPGLTYHLAKILECGARASTLGSGNDCLVGRLREDWFEVVPPNPDLRCTVESVAAHTLYEKGDPTTITVPEGTVDVSAAEFEPVDDRTVRVSGSTFEARERHAVLMEGVERRGFRTITPAGIRDPLLIERVDEMTAAVADRVREVADVDEDAYHLAFRTYGGGAVSLFDDAEPEAGGELGVVVDVVADTQAAADTVCSLARAALLHHPLPGRLNTGGNLAFPYSPSDLSVGPVYELSIYHLVTDAAPDAMYELEMAAAPTAGRGSEGGRSS